MKAAWRAELLEERKSIMSESGLDGRKMEFEASQDTAKKYWEMMRLFRGTGWSRNKITRFLERG